MGATPVQEIATVTADGVTAITKAYTSNVAVGNLLVITCGRFNATQVAFTAADCTLSAGTATLGTIALDANAQATPTEAIESGVWSAPVTAGGSATIRIAGSTGAYFEINVNEYSGVDASGSRVAGTPTSNFTNTAGVSPATSPSVTTPGDSLFVGAVATDYAGTALAPVAGNAFTLIGSSTNGSLHQTGASVRKIVTGASTDSLSVSLATTSLNGWCACLVAYKAAASAAAVGAPLAPSLLRPFSGIIGRAALAMRSVRPPAALSSTADVTLSPAAASSTWTAPDPVLTPGGVTLTPTAAISTWVANSPTLSVGSLTLSPTAATSSWTVPAPSLSVGAVSLAPSAASSTWAAPAPVLSIGPVTLSPTASVATWNAGVATLTPGALSLTPSAAVSTWSTPTAVLSGGSQLTPSAAVSTWNVGVTTLSAGPVTLSTTAAVRTWNTPTPVLAAGGVVLAPNAASRAWVAGAPVLSVGPLTLASAAATRAWVAGAASLGLGGVILVPSAAVAAWVAGTAILVSAAHHLDEPLSIDFASLAAAIDFANLASTIEFASLATDIDFTQPTTTIDFDSLETVIVFLDGGIDVLELTIIKGELTPIAMTLRGASPTTGDLVPYDVTAATSVKLNAGKPGAPLIITAKDLAKTDAVNGRVTYNPAIGETDVAGRYEALVVATFAGAPGVVRKFPGKLTIKDAIA